MLRGVAVAGIVAVVLLPALYAVAMSLRPGDDIADDPLGLPTSLFLGNYAGVLQTMNYLRAVANTLGITVVVTVVVALASSTAAYPLARLPGVLTRALYLLLTLGVAIPLFVTLTPLYVLFRNLGLLNSYLGIVIAYVAVNIPLGVFFYTSFIRSLPPELDEAAQIDGATILQVYWHVILPLLRPVTATLAFFVTLSVWNDLVYPLVFLTDDRKFTITVAVFRFLGSHGLDPTQLFPAAVLGTLPLVVVFFFLQRRIVSGITAGAVKG